MLYKRISAILVAVVGLASARPGYPSSPVVVAGAPIEAYTGYAAAAAAVPVLPYAAGPGPRPHHLLGPPIRHGLGVLGAPTITAAGYYAALPPPSPALARHHGYATSVVHAAAPALPALGHGDLLAAPYTAAANVAAVPALLAESAHAGQGFGIGYGAPAPPPGLIYSADFGHGKI